tara:strand:- start:52 stop:1182 length:1131 start_codon:yes stop_codon:yes gene_type:complete
MSGKFFPRCEAFDFLPDDGKHRHIFDLDLWTEILGKERILDLVQPLSRAVNFDETVRPFRDDSSTGKLHFSEILKKSLPIYNPDKDDSKIGLSHKYKDLYTGVLWSSGLFNDLLGGHVVQTMIDKLEIAIKESHFWDERETRKLGVGSTKKRKDANSGLMTRKMRKQLGSVTNLQEHAADTAAADTAAADTAADKADKSAVLDEFPTEFIADTQLLDFVDTQLFVDDELTNLMNWNDNLVSVDDILATDPEIVKNKNVVKLDDFYCGLAERRKYEDNALITKKIWTIDKVVDALFIDKTHVFIDKLAQETVNIGRRFYEEDTDRFHENQFLNWIQHFSQATDCSGNPTNEPRYIWHHVGANLIWVNPAARGTWISH